MVFNRKILLELTKATQEVIHFVKTLLNPGANTREIWDEAVLWIRSNYKHYRPAFPICISVNEEIAHCMPHEGFNRILKKGDTVSIDFGFQSPCDHIVDNARTFEVGGSNSYSKLINASKEAYFAGVSQWDSSIANFGTAVSNSITEKGFYPIRGLSGHSIEIGRLHGDIRVPNCYSSDLSDYPLPEGLYSCEPLLSTHKVNSFFEGDVPLSVDILEFSKFIDDSSPFFPILHLRERCFALGEMALLFREPVEQVIDTIREIAPSSLEYGLLNSEVNSRNAHFEMNFIIDGSGFHQINVPELD